MGIVKKTPRLELEIIEWGRKMTEFDKIQFYTAGSLFNKKGEIMKYTKDLWNKLKNKKVKNISGDEVYKYYKVKVYGEIEIIDVWQPIESEFIFMKR